MKPLLSFSAVMLMLLSFAICSTVHASSAGSKTSDENGTIITLTIGNTVIPAILHNTDPARDLVAMLPVTVSLDPGFTDTGRQNRPEGAEPGNRYRGLAGAFILVHPDGRQTNFDRSGLQRPCGALFVYEQGVRRHHHLCRRRHAADRLSAGA